MNNPEISEETRLKEILVKKGYLIDEDKNEFNEILKNIIKTNFASNVLHLIIYPTEDCNFRCEYCYQYHNKGKMNKNIQEAIILYVKKNIHNYKTLSVSWFGGEPLEAINIIEYLSKTFIDICEKNNKFYKSDITTNGYNLSADIFNSLLLYKITNFQITIDGTRETHDKQRKLESGMGSFNKIIQNLLEIKKLKKRFKIVIRCNLTQRINTIFDEYIREINYIFGNDKRYKLFLTLVSDLGGESVKKVQREFLDKNRFTKLIEKMMNPKINLELYNPEFLKISPCYAADANSYAIGSDGILYKCTSHMDDCQNIIGKINNEGKMLLNSEKYNCWTISIFDKIYNSTCKKCKFLPFCMSSFCPYQTQIKKKKCSRGLAVSFFKEFLIYYSRKNKIEEIK